MDGSVSKISFESDRRPEEAVRIYPHVLVRTISLDKGGVS